MNDLIKNDGNFLSFENFQEKNKDIYLASPKHWKELIKIVTGEEIYDSKIKKIKNPNGIRTFFTTYFDSLSRDSYYSYESKPKGEERMSIEIAKKRMGTILYYST